MGADRRSGEVVSAVSAGVVALHTRFYGKGPTRAKTHYVDGTVLCVLWGGFTKVEETLIASGRGETVAELRSAFQEAMRDEFTGVVEDATGRRVIAYFSQVSVEVGVAVEVFLLSPT